MKYTFNKEISNNKGDSWNKKFHQLNTRYIVPSIRFNLDTSAVNRHCIVKIKTVNKALVVFRESSFGFWNAKLQSAFVEIKIPTHEIEIPDHENLYS